MQATIAQLLCLTAYGNSFLAGNSLNEFFPGNSTFKFCKYVRFVDLVPSKTGSAEKPFSDNPLDWFDKIKSEGVVQLKACHFGGNQEGISDRMSVGSIGGGGCWLIECITPTGSDFWEGRWEIGDRNDPHLNIWRVTYGRIAKNVKTEEFDSPSISELIIELRNGLKEIAAFANQNDCENFGKCFANGIDSLSSEPSKGNGYRIAPTGFLTEESEKLISACQAAWVFGGMGSWNDLEFSDNKVNKKYEELSDKLFNLINISLLAAINPNRGVLPNH